MPWSWEKASGMCVYVHVHGHGGVHNQKLVRELDCANCPLRSHRVRFLRLMPRTLQRDLVLYSVEECFWQSGSLPEGDGRACRCDSIRWLLK